MPTADVSPTAAANGRERASSSGRLYKVDEPVPQHARRGRVNQRYEAGARLIAGCVPIRCCGEAGAEGPGVEVMLISSKNHNGFVLPKGGWELDETVEDAAARETVEEAGVRGDIDPRGLGVYEFFSKRNSCQCKAHMYVMHVKEVLDEWPEKARRARKWVPLAGGAAGREVLHPWMANALAELEGGLENGCWHGAGAAGS